MDQELGSIAGFCYKQTPIKVYTRQLPQDFTRPSMYLAPPLTSSKPDFIGGYKNSAVLNIKFYDIETADAMTNAQTVSDAIMNAKLLIPLLNLDGTTATGYVRINSVDVRQVDNGVAQASIKWDTYYKYTPETYAIVEKIILQVGTK